jgi:pro-apoptotic serine protease NMA111
MTLDRPHLTELDRKRVVIAYKHLRDLHSRNTHIITVDRHWANKMRLAVRNDETGLWDFKDLSDAYPPVPHTPKRAEFVKINNEKYPKAVDIIRSFVRVTASMPIKLDGFPRTRKTGHGLVIDAEKGLVVVSRAIVPYDLCDITVTIADSIIVDGEVVFLHPLQNYTIIKYDPSLVEAPVQTAKLSTEYIKQGDDTIFFGFNHNYRPVVAKTVVTDITTVGIPASAATPRYRATNLDAITVDTGLAVQCGSGVLVSEDGTVQALWLSYLGERSASTGKDMEYHLGYAVPMMLPIVEQIRKGITPELRIMPVETQTIQMSQARIMGVAESWIERIEIENPERHQLFMVRKVDSDYHGLLQESDIILTLNDKLITRVDDFNVQYHYDVLEARIVRKKQEMLLQVPTVPTVDLETRRAIVFCGAILHRPHHAVRQQISKIHSGVYISGRVRGSPAYAYGLSPTNFITHVNGVSTPDLDAFLLEARKIPDNTYFRLKVMTFDNVPWVATMKKCEHYFPTMEFLKDGLGDKATAGWRRIVLEAEKGGADGLIGEDSVDVGGEAEVAEPGGNMKEQ